MNVLVTGAAGFLGRHVVDTLRLEHHVATTSRSRQYDSGTILLNLADAASLSKLPTGLDAVVHLAAHVPAKIAGTDRDAAFSENARATLNLLEFCARNKIKTFVLGSTWSVLGESPSELPQTEEAVPLPSSFYGLSKLAAERLTTPYNFVYGMRIPVLRFAYMYGAGMREDTVVQKFASLARSESPITLINDGRDQTDLVYAKDAAQAVANALGRGDGIYNIGSGKPATIRELAETTLRVLKSTSRLEVKAYSGTALKVGLSIEKASRELGWTPKYGLEAGLADFLLPAP
jgi:UDP-glucose 4-epimerase